LATHGEDTTANDVEPVHFEHPNNNSSEFSPTTAAAPSGSGMRRNRSQEAFDGLVNVLKTIRQR